MKNIVDVIQIEQDDPLGSLIRQVRAQQEEIMALKQQLEALRVQNQEKDELIAALCQEQETPNGTEQIENKSTILPRAPKGNPCQHKPFLRQYRQQTLLTGIQGETYCLSQRPKTAQARGSRFGLS